MEIRIIRHVDNYIIDLVKYCIFPFKDYLILELPEDIPNPENFDFGIKECYIRLDEPPENVNHYEWILHAIDNIQIQPTPFDGAIHIESKIFYKCFNPWTGEIDESFSLGWKLKKIYHEHKQDELIAELQRMAQSERDSGWV